MKQKIRIAALMLIWMLALVGTVYGFITIHHFRHEAATVETEDAEDYEPQPTLTARELFDLIEYNGMLYGIIDDYLFYVNTDSYVYRFNLSTYCHQLYLQIPVFGVITEGDTLFIIIGTPPDSAIMAIDTINGHMQVVAVDVNAYKEWRIDNGIIFFWDISGQERSILPCGRPIVL